MLYEGCFYFRVSPCRCTIFTITLSSIVIVSVNSQSCNHDGVLDTGEECDDGNRIDNDGCEDCILSLSLDLLSSNNITTNYSKEFFDLDEVVYFVEPSELRFTLSLTQVRRTNLYG